MNNHAIKVFVRDSQGKTDSYEFNTDDVSHEEHGFSVMGHDFVFKDKMVFHSSGTPVYARVDNMTEQEQAYADLGDGFEAIAEVERLYEVVTHPKGYTCGKCRHFDNETGAQELNRRENAFANGSYGLLQVVMQYTARDAGSSQTSPTTVGWCGPKQAIVDEVAPACQDDFAKKPGFLKKMFGGGR